jgi:hypothetical protein
VFVDVDTIPAPTGLTSTNNSNFEALNPVNNAISYDVLDVEDTVTATLTADVSEISETGGTIRYTVTLTGGPSDIDPDTDLVFALANGESVTITAGSTTGYYDKVYSDADITDQVSINNAFAVTAVTSGGAEYENLVTTGSTSVDVDYTPVITDLTPKAQGGDVTVDEDDLANGSDTSKESTTQIGTFTIAAGDGISSLTVGGQAVITNGTFAATSFTTALGNTLAFTGFNAVTGEITYSYTLLDNETHSDANGENSLFEDFDVVLLDTDLDQATGTLSVNIIDDVVSSTDNDVTVNNAASQTVSSVITFNWGADGAGSVILSDPSDIVLPDGDVVTFTVTDGNGDGAQDLYGYIDGVQVLSLESSVTGSEGSYDLTLDSMLDLTPTSSFEVGNILAGSPTNYLIIQDQVQTTDSIVIKASTNMVGGEVNSNTGELGVNNTILNTPNSGNNESLIIEFGNQGGYDLTTGEITDPAVLNNVQVAGVNVGSGIDSFVWTAYLDGVEVGSDTATMSTQAGSYLSDTISTANGFDTLVITMATGDFKFSGFDYTLDGDDILAELDVSYTVTDTDADSVSGAISIDIGNDLNTLIVPDTNDNGV